MPLSSDDVLRQLLKKFHFEAAPGTRHDTYTLIINGRRAATTRFSRGRRRTLPDNLLRVMAHEIHAPSLAFFRGMIECTVSNEEYLDHLRQEGHIKD